MVTPAEQTDGDNTANASTLIEGKAKKKGLLGTKTELSSFVLTAKILKFIALTFT